MRILPFRTMLLRTVPSTIPFKIACALALPALLSPPGPVCAQAPAGVRQAIQARYNQFDRAYMQKDFRSVGEVFTGGCLMKLQSENRSMKAPRVIQGMQAVSKSLTVTHARTRILSVQPEGAAYAVSAVWSGDSSYLAVRGAQDDHPRRGRTQQTFRDTWKKTGAEWQIVQRIIQG